MKNIYLVVLLLLLISTVQSQNFTSNLSVTKDDASLILVNTGTSQYSNSSLLFKSDNVPSGNYYRFYAHKEQVNNAGFWSFRFIKRHDIFGYLTYLMFQDETNDIRFNVNNTFTNDENYGNILFENGSVGIGTSDPDEKLHVNGTTTITANIGSINDAIWKTGQHTLELQNSDAGDVVLAFHRAGYGSASIRHSSIGGLTLTGNGSFGENHLHINADGKIGIGTTDFTGNHKLRVEGSIGAREIKVEASSWSDFVFEKEYELRTLEEVESYITENKHLPEIPSEAEVTENGITLGVMNAKLLQKIEELTLYLIEQNKELKSQKEQNESQQELIEQLRNEVSALKNE